jgi:excisionase family DNA binding protein
METIYTLKEAAELLKMHRNTVFNMVTDGRIKASKIGNKYVITETEVKRVRGV